MTTERPIIFNGEMVRAILREVDPKTMTRRVIRGLGNSDHYGKLLGDWGLSELPHRWDGIERIWQWRGKGTPQKGDWIWPLQRDVDDHYTWPMVCPYGQPGDRLWVRETHRFWKPDPSGLDGHIYRSPLWEGAETVLSPEYRGGPTLPDDEDPWRPSIHLPKWAARIWLEVADVRVERVQDISEEDVKAEGLRGDVYGEEIGIGPREDGRSRSIYFMGLWDSINAKRGYSWESNPWVWVVEFERLAP